MRFVNLHAAQQRAQRELRPSDGLAVLKTRFQLQQNKLKS